MAGKRTILAEDGPLGKAGTEVWVNDDTEADEAENPAKKSAAKKSAAKKKSSK